MGYTTEFEGEFFLDRPLTEEHYQEIEESLDDRLAGCQWEIGDDRKTVKWDGGEKFYEYIEWLQKLIDEFFKPWGYQLNGRVEWYGEERKDTGCIKVTDNVIKVTDDWKKSEKSKKLKKERKLKIQELEKYIEYLENHIKYMPEGEGALAAKAEFLKLTNS